MAIDSGVKYKRLLSREIFLDEDCLIFKLERVEGGGVWSNYQIGVRNKISLSEIRGYFLLLKKHFETPMVKITKYYEFYDRLELVVSISVQKRLGVAYCYNYRLGKNEKLSLSLIRDRVKELKNHLVS